MLNVSICGLTHDELDCRILEKLLYPLKDQWDLLWGNITSCPFNISEITHSNQIGLCRKILIEKIKHNDNRPIRLVHLNNRLTIWDGSHRFSANKLIGIKMTIMAKTLLF